jgi:hypothetical protein
MEEHFQETGKVDGGDRGIQNGRQRITDDGFRSQEWMSRRFVRAMIE